MDRVYFFCGSQGQQHHKRQQNLGCTRSEHSRCYMECTAKESSLGGQWDYAYLQPHGRKEELQDTQASNPYCMDFTSTAPKLHPTQSTTIRYVILVSVLSLGQRPCRSYARVMFAFKRKPKRVNLNRDERRHCPSVMRYRTEGVFVVRDP